jgi:Icc protein
MPAVVLQLSDIHLPRDRGVRVFGADADERLAVVVEAWAATGRQADLVLLTGDLTDDGDPGAYERLARILSELGAPILALAGNHDRPEAVAATWGGADVAEVAGWRIVTADTTVAGEVHGAIDVARVMRRLDDLDDRPTLLALHHPPLSRSTHPQFHLHGDDALLDELAARPQVRAVVAGHLHDSVELHSHHDLPVLLGPSTVMGITHLGDEMLIDPGAHRGAQVLELDDDGTFTSFLLEA